MSEAAASCKDITRAPVTNWEPHGVTLAGYCYAVRHGMKVQLVTPYRVSDLRSYDVKVRDNVTSVDPPLIVRFLYFDAMLRSQEGFGVKCTKHLNTTQIQDNYSIRNFW